MDMKINIKEFFKGILLVLLYLIMGALVFIPFSFLYTMKLFNKEAVYICGYAFLAFIFVLIFNKDVIKDWKNFKKDYKRILKISFSWWLKGFMIMIISSMIIQFLNLDANVNQEENIKLLKEIPLAEILCACVFAPIIEELVFRRGFKNIAKSHHVTAIISGLLFGFMHVYTSLELNNLLMLLYIFPYGGLGVAFGYAYRKTNNIFGTIVIHAMHNTISIVELLLIGCIL